MIYVECEPDYVLATHLTRRRVVQHSGNKSRIMTKLQKVTASKAMIDEDPGSLQATYISKLQKTGAVDIIPSQGIKVLHDNPNDNHIVLLCPRLEEWILEAAHLANIDVRRYYLPNTPDELKDVLTFKHKHVMNNFKRLLRALENVPGRILTLATLLRQK